MLKGIIGFIHGGAQAAHAHQLVNAVDGFHHAAGLRLQDHLGHRNRRAALLRFAHLFTRPVNLVAPIDAHQHFGDVLTQAAVGHIVVLILLRFQQRLI